MFFVFFFQYLATSMYSTILLATRNIIVNLFCGFSGGGMSSWGYS
jgi:hypothetical protein